MRRSPNLKQRQHYAKALSFAKRAFGIARETLVSRGFVSSVAALGTGAVFAQLVGVLGTAWTARLFLPEDFGLLALFTAVSLFFLPLVSGKYECAVMLPESDAEAAQLVGLSCGIALLTSSCLCVGALFFSKALLALAGAKSSAALLWTVGAPLNLFIWGLNQVFGFWCTRIKKFHQMAVARFVTSVITTGSPVLLYAAGLHTGEALVLGGIAGQAIGTAYLVFIGFRKRELGHFWHGAWRPRLAMLGQYRKFPLFGAPYSLVGGIGKQLLTIIIKSLAGLHVLGLVYVAMRTVYLPVSLIAGSIRPVFYQRVCSDLNAENTSAFVNKIIRVLMTVVAPFLIFFCFNASYLFRLFLGARWEAAGSYGTMLAIVSFLLLCTSWLDRVFDAHGKQHISLIWEILHTSAMLGALTFGLVYIGKPVLAVGLYVAMDASFELVWLKLAFSCGGFDFSELRGTLFSLCRFALLFSALMFACRLAAQPLQLILSVIFAGAAGAFLGLRCLNAGASPMDPSPACD
jgi:O-antigen/teichoic acid export membrane protein